MTNQTSLAQFKAVYPMIRDELMKYIESYNLSEYEVRRYQAIFDENLPHGKCNRGISVPESASILLGITLSEEDYLKAASLGWMIELVHVFFLVHDDIMDHSPMRHGKPCWYLHDGIGMSAVNDACILESAVFVLLKKFFRSHPAYLDIIELFHETILQTEVGQLCDMNIAERARNTSQDFNMDEYKVIVVHKTAYYSFFLPVALALHHSGLGTTTNLKQAEKILLLIGEYYQVQDDYLDNYGDSEILGKIGTDIKDNKCSWLIIQALQIATDNQRKSLRDNYGRDDDEKQKNIQILYDELNLETRFREFEDKIVAMIRTLIDSIDESEGLKREVFNRFLREIHRRNK